MPRDEEPFAELEELERRRSRAPIAHPGRALVLLAVGIVIGIVIVAKTGATPSPSLQLGGVSSTSTVSQTSPASSTTTAPARTTTTLAAPKPAGQVSVVVANGTTISGAAGRIGAELATIGYKNYSAVDTTSQVSTSSVYYAPGYQANAVAIASFLQMKAAPSSMPSTAPVSASTLANADILVIVGPDLASSATSSSTG